MKFTWQSATGPITEDIPEEWNEILVQMDREDYNSWKRDHRNEEREGFVRHNYSMDAMEFEGEEFGREDEGITELTSATDLEIQLLEALSELTEQQRKLVEALYYKEKSGKEYAEELGISPAAVTQQKAVILKKLKNILEQP